MPSRRKRSASCIVEHHTLQAIPPLQTDPSESLPSPHPSGPAVSVQISGDSLFAHLPSARLGAILAYSLVLNVAPKAAAYLPRTERRFLCVSAMSPYSSVSPRPRKQVARTTTAASLHRPRHHLYRHRQPRRLSPHRPVRHPRPLPPTLRATRLRRLRPGRQARPRGPASSMPAEGLPVRPTSHRWQFLPSGYLRGHQVMLRGMPMNPESVQRKKWGLARGERYDIGVSPLTL